MELDTENTPYKSTLKINSQGLKSNYAWKYKSYFRSRAYSWRGTQLASKRIKEAIKEINQIKKNDSLLAAEGAIYLMSRFWPAFQIIDTSSGSLGNAVWHAMDKLLPIIIEAPVALPLRQQWLDILWQILEDDGVDYVYEMVNHWGPLCGYKEEASRRADEFISLVKTAWKYGDSCVYYDVACLSALFYSERYDEILPLIELAPYQSERLRKYGARVLAMTDLEKAISYAEESRQTINVNPQAIDQFCEELLIEAGQMEAAYKRYAIQANEAHTYLLWFNAIKKKYSTIRTEQKILSDLIERNVTEPGKWFATANKIKCYDLALELARTSPADPKTLNRAAKASLEAIPHYALNVALASLHWMIKGYGYEITNHDVRDAISIIKDAAKKLDVEEQTQNELREIAKNDCPEFFSRIILSSIGR